MDMLPLTHDFYLHRLIAGVHLAGLFLIAIAVAAAWRWGLARRNKLALLLPLTPPSSRLWRSTPSLLRACRRRRPQLQPPLGSLKTQQRFTRMAHHFGDAP